jgi:hypothetical protein
MNHKILLTAALSALVAAGSATASPISPEQARARAFSGNGFKAKSLSLNDVRLVHTEVMDNGNASAYIFASPSKPGFTILSANDIAVPVLGYSDSESIDGNNLPPSLTWWLNEMGRRIEWLESKGVRSDVTKPYAPESWNAVGPLMTTTWNQDAPYNANCPVISGVQAPTGCVATSFAQVMNYFKYPEKGRGTISYRDGSVTRRLSLNKNFDWDNMLDSYTGSYTEAQAEAVAFLMQACGYAVEMGYGRDASGAQSYKLMEACTNYFKYANDIFYTDRELYSTAKWSEMVYNNIKNVGPVIYDGRSIEGGHSFVCDGYDGNGYFHFNWGWGGMSDGYYVLDALNPESQGIGGAEGGFNYSQGALFNMHIPGDNDGTKYDNLRIYGSVRATLSGSDITFRTYSDGGMQGWGNGSYKQISCFMGAIFEKADGTVAREVQGDIHGLYSSITLSATSYYGGDNVYPIITIPEGLADGRYRVVLAAQQTGSSDEDPYPWQPMLCDYGAINYCWLTVTGSKYTVENVSPAKLEYGGKGLASKLYVSRNALLEIEATNDTDIQLTNCFMPVLVRDNKIQYIGDYMLITADANSKTVKQAPVEFFASKDATSTGVGTYTLRLLDASTQTVIADYGEVEMSYIASGFALTLDRLCVDGAEIKDVTSGSRTFKDANVVTSSEFDIFFDYSVKSGYFDSSIRLIMAYYNPDTNKFEADGENYYYAIPFLSQGETVNAVVPMNLKGHPGGVYRVTASYVLNGQNRSLGTMYVSVPTSGIDDIVTEGEGNAEFYNLQGIRIKNPAKGQIVIVKKGNMTSKVRF